MGSPFQGGGSALPPAPTLCPGPCTYQRSFVFPISYIVVLFKLFLRDSTAQKQKWDKATSPDGVLFLSSPRYYDFLDQKNFLLPFPTYQISPRYYITSVLPLSTWVLVGLPLITGDWPSIQRCRRHHAMDLSWRPAEYEQGTLCDIMLRPTQVGRAE